MKGSRDEKCSFLVFSFQELCSPSAQHRSLAQPGWLSCPRGQLPWLSLGSHTVSEGSKKPLLWRVPLKGHFCMVRHLCAAAAEGYLNLLMPHGNLVRNFSVFLNTSPAFNSVVLLRDSGTSGMCCQHWGLSPREGALLTGGLQKGLLSIGMWHQTKRICFIYAQPGAGFDPSAKKMESWMLSVVKILFWVKLQGHQPNLNSPPVFPWPPHFQVIIVSPSFLHSKLSVHKNYYLCQKLSVFFNAHWRYYKNVQGL